MIYSDDVKTIACREVTAVREQPASLIRISKKKRRFFDKINSLRVFRRTFGSQLVPDIDWH